MDIYRETQKVVSNVKMKPNRGIIWSNLVNDASAVAAVAANTTPWLITYGPDGTTYATPMGLPEDPEPYLIPIRMWGVSFDSRFSSAFGVS